MNLKKWLLPSNINNHHPFALRPLGLSLVFALIMIFHIGYNLAAARELRVLGYATNISASEVMSLTNQQRANNGLGALAYSAQLEQAARAKAQDMFDQNYWSHYNPQGNGPAYFISAAGYSYSTAGENLAKDFNTSSGVVTAWMNSAGHRANILNGSFIHTGVAVMNGTLQGSETTLVVAMYAAPSTPPPAPAPVPPPAPSSTTVQAQNTSVAEPNETPIIEEQPPEPEEEVTQEPAAPSATSTNNTPPPEQPSGQVQAAEVSIVTREQLNWAQQASLVLLSTILLINVLKHTIVWRTNRRGWRHIWFRAHPAVQYALILVAIISTLSSSMGVIR
jgi:hypothetical protein